MTKLAGLLGLLWAGAASAASVPFTLVFNAAGPGPQNTIVMTDVSGSTVANYPFQFGREFLAGAIPAGQCPVVNGLPTQADIKNTYPDGSVRFAVMAVVVPSLANGVPQTLTFAPGSCNNTALTTAQMLDPAYNFDMQANFTGSAYLLGGVVTPAQQTLANWKAITNGGFTATIDGAPVNVTGLNFSAISAFSGVAPIIQAGLVAAGSSAKVVWQTSLSARMILYSTTFGPTTGMTFALAPTTGTDISATLDWQNGQGGNVQSGVSTSAPSARTMLTNGDCKPWTSGPIAQTMICQDATTARRYDVGFGDGFHPLRPSFYATFWPATHQVFVRGVFESGLSTEMEDLQYKVALSTGMTPTQVYTGDLSGGPADLTAGYGHKTATGWTQEYWLGGAPVDQVNIDPNILYLAGTRVIANYPAGTIPPATVAFEALQWTGHPHDIYQPAWWDNIMGDVGARDEIAPYPAWAVEWLYSGDYRLRVMAFGMADRALAWPALSTEVATGKRLLRTDPAGSSGLGLPMSITDRKTMKWNVWLFGSTADNPIIVGPYTTAARWTYDFAHEPSAFYVQYVVTGDPFYLHGMRQWAASDASIMPYTYHGPTRTEGGISDQPRGDAWVLRNRAETAFMMPDGDPMKTYFIYLTNDALARWEGAALMTGTAYDGSAEKLWATANSYPAVHSFCVGSMWSSHNSGPLSCGAPPLGQFESQGPVGGPISNGQVQIKSYNGCYACTITTTAGSNVGTWSAGTTGIIGDPAVGVQVGMGVSSTNLPKGTLANGGAGTVIGSVGPGNQLTFVMSNNNANPANASATGTDINAMVGYTGTETDTWMHGYLTYAIGRTAELGFAALPLLNHVAELYLQMDADNTTIFPVGNVDYNFPVEDFWGNNYMTMPDILSKVYTTARINYLSINDGHAAVMAGSDAYPHVNSAGISFLPQLGARGAAAWARNKALFYDISPWFSIPATGGNPNPKWALVPRLDTNVLPAIPVN